MGSDDDADELAELRAQRAARLGGAAGLSSLKEKQRRVQASAEAANQYLEGARGARPEAGGADEAGPPPPQQHQQQSQQYHHHSRDDEDDEDAPVVVGFVDEGELEDQQLRLQLPLAFGAQETKVAKPDELHDKFKRSGAAAGGAAATGAGKGGAAGAPSVGPPRPPSFGPPRPPARPAAAAAGDAAGTSAAGGSGREEDGRGEEQDLVGPPRPLQEDGGDEGAEAGLAGADGEGEGGGGGGVGSDDYDGEEDDSGDPWLLPVSHEVALTGHTRAVSALDIDHSGSRIVTGGLDYMVRIYDFNGMKSDMRAFRELEPQEGHPVHAVSWSPTGDAFIAITGSSKAKIYDRDGLTRGEFIRGDMYIRDMKNTKGHVSGLCGGQWHPTDRFTAMTCSEDGTVRIWDTHNIMQKTVIKPNLAKPVRTAVSACRYGSEGRLIAAGLNDGSIQLWSVTGKFGTSAAVGQVLPPTQQMVEKQGWSYVSRPNHLVRSAHKSGEEITSLAFSRDGNTLLSRGMDATMKVWDLRKFKEPVRVFGDLPCAHANTMAIFSPDEQLVLTGVNTGQPQDEMGALVIYDRAKGELVRKLGMPGNVTALAWHPRLNQIFVGTGNRKTGATRVLYDTTFSERGVLVAAARMVRKPSPFDFQPPLLVKEYDPTRKRRRGEVKVNPSKARCPDPGQLAGVGRQGRIGTSTKTLLTQHIMKTKGKLTHVDETKDPREALLKHADKVDEFSSYTAAYAATQPKPIFETEPVEEEEEQS